MEILLLINDIQKEIDRLNRLLNQKDSDYIRGEIEAYIQVLSRLKMI